MSDREGQQPEELPVDEESLVDGEADIFDGFEGGPAGDSGLAVDEGDLLDDELVQAGPARRAEAPADEGGDAEPDDILAAAATRFLAARERIKAKSIVGLLAGADDEEELNIARHGLVEAAGAIKEHP